MDLCVCRCRAKSNQNSLISTLKYQLLNSNDDLVLMMTTLDMVLMVTTLKVKQLLKLAQAVKDAQGG